MVLAVCHVERLWAFMCGVELVHLSTVCRSARDLFASFARYVEPSRLVMLPLNQCTLCDRFDDRCETVCSHWHDGWQACSRCRPRMLYSHTMWACQRSALGTQNCTSPLKVHQLKSMPTVRFYRRRLDGTQAATMVANFHTWLVWSNQRLWIQCVWTSSTDENVGRLVRLDNLLVHNHDLFKACLDTQNLTERAAGTWSARIARERQRALEFWVLLWCLRERGIRLDVHLRRVLYDRWRCGLQ